MAKNVFKNVLNFVFFAVFNRSKNKPEEDVLNGLIFDSKSASTTSKSAARGPKV